MRGYSKYFWVIHFVGDIILLNFSFFLTYYLKFDSFIFEDNYRFLVIIFNAVWILVVLMLSLYQLRRIRRIDRILFNLFKAFIFNSITISAILFSLKASNFSREQLYATYILLFFLIIVWRLFMLKIIMIYRRSGYNYSNIVIIGGGGVAHQLYNYFSSDDMLGVKLLAIFFDRKINFKLNDNIFQLNLDKIREFVIEKNVDEIYYTLPLTNTNKIKSLVEFCDKNMIRFKVVPDFRAFIFKRVNIDFFDDVPIITLREEPLTDFVNRVIKRIFDILFSLSVIILILSWLYPLIAIIIKLNSKGPILFKQKRSGIDNKEFVCYKFRSMTVNKDSDSKQATKNDMRITRVGKFLRKTSLDEFPQFINVLIGDMSIVGPRPHMIKHTNEYSVLIQKYMVRQLVKPGITGAAQVRGFRGETKSLKDMEGRIRFDVWYIENWSLSLDINIIFKTIWNIFKGDDKAF
ncbi:MAG: undecaprenyl-phosphate glucose phosphotransferase [Flavobacteriales bacterium]|nr:undecaprenyl-phosphate glucose phosphotransferase [Flavobacteriales bacterium]